MIKKTLVFQAPYPHNRILVWDVSSQGLRSRAYVDLFKIMDSELDAYAKQDTVVCALLKLARNGNPEACEALLCYNRNRTGQKFEEVEVRLPSPDVPVLLDAEDRISIDIAPVECPLPSIEDVERARVNGTK